MAISLQQVLIHPKTNVKDVLSWLHMTSNISWRLHLDHQWMAKATCTLISPYITDDPKDNPFYFIPPDQHWWHEMPL